MTKFKLFQIYYDNQTRLTLDPNFIPLDNTGSSNSSWFEYLPIRNYLKNTKLDEDTFYGFFSPKFKFKTNLTAKDVLNFLEKHEAADVVLFSPFFENTAYYLNVFEQAKQHHENFEKISVVSAEYLKLEINPMDLVMHSLNTVYCNYFAAKSDFWYEWLNYCEEIFKSAEYPNSNLGILLNESISHDGQFVPSKIFIIERIASLLMCAYPNRWKVCSLDPIQSSFGDSILSQHKDTLLQLDALKIACSLKNSALYLHFFYQIRNELNKKINYALSTQ